MMNEQASKNIHDYSVFLLTISSFLCFCSFLILFVYDSFILCFIIYLLNFITMLRRIKHTNIMNNSKTNQNEPKRNEFHESKLN